jgi:hypothetical protein
LVKTPTDDPPVVRFCVVIVQVEHTPVEALHELPATVPRIESPDLAVAAESLTRFVFPGPQQAQLMIFQPSGGTSLWRTGCRMIPLCTPGKEKSTPPPKGGLGGTVQKACI